MPGQEHDLNLIAALVEGRLDPRDRARVLEHLAACAQCRATLAMLGRGAHEGLVETAKPSAHGGTRAAPRRRWSPAVWLPIAASVAVAAVALRLAMTPETPSADAPPIDESLLPTRAAGRVIDGKTFRMHDGEWVDQAYQPGATVIEIQGHAAREELFARVPALRRYGELGDRVIVVHEGAAYRFSP